jgi:long-subunit fatty acid transport protein
MIVKLNTLSMRKIFTLISALSISGSLLAGGLVTNNNQSAMFTRLQNRNASTSIDAVFYNPAGLTKLGNGFFASINNQTIGQTKTVGDDYGVLSGDKPKEYIGKVNAPIFPGIYMAYNTGKLSFSAGFNPVGGGGGAEYKEGLPSFESQVAELVPMLAIQNQIPTSQYSSDIYFKGSSIYFGFQGNVAYKINDKFSVAVGGRLVSARNAYQGYMRNIRINPNFPAFGTDYNGTNMVLASDFFNAGADFFTSLPAQATGAATQLQQPITAGYGSVLLANAGALGMSASAIQGIQALLKAKGLSDAQIGAATISSAQTELNNAGNVYLAKAAAMSVYSAKTAGLEVDAEQTGMAFTPILSFNYSPIENLNIAVKYEFKTNLELKTKVNDGKSGGGIYIQDSISKANLPAILFVGTEYKPFDKLMLSGTFNYYWDKNVDYDGQEDVSLNMIDKNFLEFGLGAEYAVTEKLRVSAGWLATVTGVNENYQNDITYSANTNSFGFGFGYRINNMIDLNVGGQYTDYATATRSFTRLASINETLDKKTWIVGVGADFFFGK